MVRLERERGESFPLAVSRKFIWRGWDAQSPPLGEQSRVAEWQEEVCGQLAPLCPGGWAAACLVAACAEAFMYTFVYGMCVCNVRSFGENQPSHRRVRRGRAADRD